MGFGIFKKIKQGLTKISDFGKKALKSVMDNAPKVIDATDSFLSKTSTFGDKIVKSGIADSLPSQTSHFVDKALERLNIDKNKLLQNMNNVNEKVQSINFAGRSWRPKFN